MGKTLNRKEKFEVSKFGMSNGKVYETSEQSTAFCKYIMN